MSESLWLDQDSNLSPKNDQITVHHETLHYQLDHWKCCWLVLEKTSAVKTWNLCCNLMYPLGYKKVYFSFQAKASCQNIFDNLECDFPYLNTLSYTLFYQQKKWFQDGFINEAHVLKARSMQILKYKYFAPRTNLKNKKGSSPQGTPNSSPLW